MKMPKFTKSQILETLHKPERSRRRTTLASKRSFVSQELRIQHHPAEIENRPVPGHWESDFIKGAYNRSAIGVLS